MDYLSDKIAATIRSKKLFSKNARILVGVSGGVDSVVLLNVLVELADQHGWRLAVVHVNHGLRGRASGDDARFVHRMAKRLNLPCFVEKMAVAKRAKADGVSIEMAAREARHAVFRSAAKEFRAREIALAHHRDDQVEQFFLKLFRGAGLDGLSGMSFQAAGVLGGRLKIVRPMLATAREDIVKFARDSGLPFREDASNADSSIARNRVRNKLIPLLEREYSTAIRLLVDRAMTSLRGDAECLSWIADQRSSGGLDNLDFDRLPEGLKRRLVLSGLRSHGVAGEYDMVEQLLAGRVIEILEGRRFALSASGRVEPVRDSGGFGVPGDGVVEIPVRAKSQLVCWNGSEMRIQRSKRKKSRSATEVFDADEVGDMMYLRRWRAGDRYQPIGLNGSRKLQDCFTDSGVPKAERHQRAVLTDAGDRIIWVEGLRIGEQFKVTHKTNRIVEMHWKAGSI